MTKPRFEVVAFYIDKKTGFKKYLEFGAYKQREEAEQITKQLRVEKPDFTFSIKQIEGWD